MKGLGKISFTRKDGTAGEVEYAAVCLPCTLLNPIEVVFKEYIWSDGKLHRYEDLCPDCQAAESRARNSQVRPN
jgi:hypothetical protein